MSYNFEEKTVNHLDAINSKTSIFFCFIKFKITTQ